MLKVVSLRQEDRTSGGSEYFNIYGSLCGISIEREDAPELFSSDRVVGDINLGFVK